MSGILQPGTPAPDFVLYATPDQKIALHELRGRNVILAFYPADWSEVCGDEMVLFNQTLPLFQKYNAVLMGISVDGRWCHQAFAKARNLQFPLLADFEPKGAVSKLYGSYNEAEGYSKRTLFVIDENGIIAWSYESPEALNPGANGILDALEKLQTKK